MFLKHDLTAVASLQEDVTAKWGRVNTAWVSGLLSFAESRKALGYEQPNNDDLFLTRKSFAMAFADVVMHPQEQPAIEVGPIPPQLEETQQEEDVAVVEAA